MRQKIYIIIAVFILFLGGMLTTGQHKADAATKPTYTISPKSKTYKGNMTNYSTYNKYTKDYYLIRSYLEQLEKTGGGKLVLKKGTYTITNALYVPSNVTIELKDGATIKKGTKTGTKTFSASKSIFQLIKPSKSHQKGVYGKHDGEKNISIIGHGNATIDLGYMDGSIAIIAGHNRNITIKGIHFKNLNAGHFIEIDATKDAVITNNTFINSKASAGKNKEAINVDTPDKTTLGFGSPWTKYDKTPNDNMLIENNVFKNLDVAIGTHKYSGGKYHNKVIIRNNQIEKTRRDAIIVMNWSNAIIENNLIKNVAPGANNNNNGIWATGAINPTFQNNVIVSSPRPIQFLIWKNTGPGSQYDVTQNKISTANKRALETNTIIDYEEDFVRIYKKYKEYGKANTDFVDVKTGIFSDLLEGDGGYTETIDLVDQDIIKGYPDYRFKPHNSISREHVAAMLTRTKALDLETPVNVSAAVAKYSDVTKNYVYAKEIATVTEAGIFGGSGGKFNPTDKITRGQMASVLVGAFDLEDTGEPVHLIDLNKIDPSHRENVKILAQHKITLGKTNKHGQKYFDASANLSRVQFTQLLHRTLEEY